MSDKMAACVAGVIAAVSAVFPAIACAQAWSLQGGAVARGEYNDNYFLTSADPQSAFTASITPFVTAARRTETSDVAVLLAVGANKVWGPSPTTEYVSVRTVADGVWRDARSTWTGNASFTRSPILQAPTGTTSGGLVLAFTNSSSASGGYTYAFTDRWSLGATAGVYDNTYDSVAGSATFSNNHGFVAIGKADYAYSESTQLTLAAGFTNYFSNLTDDNVITTTIGVSHRVSPQLTLSASIGGFWSVRDTAATDLAAASRFHDSAPLYGGSVRYALSERTEFAAGLSQYVVPSGYGTLVKSSSVAGALTHQFSDRLTGRVGAGYTRVEYPSTVSTNSSSDKTYAGEAGISYLLAERWKVEMGYRYTRAQYAQTPGQPVSNLGFVSIGYNWPGQSFTDWVGRSPNAPGLPGAGPLSLPDNSRGSSASQSESARERSLFEPFTIP